jgi:hypothetical protein
VKEELLRETLRRAVGGGPPAGDAFTRFQARQRRSARLRMLAAVGVGLLAMVALFVMLPGPGNEGPPANIAATGTARPNIERPFQYIDRLAKFEFQYPRYWDGEKTEGVVVALFPDDPALAKRYTDATVGTPSIETPRRFYMQVRVIDRAGARAARGHRRAGTHGPGNRREEHRCDRRLHDGRAVVDVQDAGAAGGR